MPTEPLVPPGPPAAAAPQRAWRSLAELAESPDLRAELAEQAPRHAAVWDRQMSRRRFLQLAGAALGLAGLAACGLPPREQIVPYVRQPEAVEPGRALYFATTMALGGYGLGLLVKSREGRPIKIEGNPSHPASLGATDALAQASILELYDPDRSQAVRFQGQTRAWDDFWPALFDRLASQSGGAGLRLLTETVTSPSLAAQIAAVLKAYPQAVWHQYQPVHRDSARAGALLAFGADTEPVYHLEAADVILSLGADFLFAGPGAVRYAHDFARRRRPEAGPLNRFYALDSHLTSTSAMADHRLPLRAGDLPAFAAALAAALGAGPASSLPAAVPPAWFAALVRDLQQHPRASLVIPGPGQPPELHALAHAINAALGAVGHTLTYIDPIASNSVDETASLRDLSQAMSAGQVQTLLILGGNPVYSAPADLDFGQQLKQVGLAVHLGLYEDETSALCGWHLPESHYLEAWGDARAYDGTASLVQPLISPLYSSLSALEFLAHLAQGPSGAAPSGYNLVRAVWRPKAGGDFERYWSRALNDGLLPDTAAPQVNRPLAANFTPQLPPATAAPGSLEVVFQPDPAVFDGRFANNPWLQEWPRPVTQLTWDNAALLAPATAARLGLDNDQLVEISGQGRALSLPVFIVPGHALDSITLHLGYGRARAGGVGTGVGFNANVLRTAGAPWRLPEAQLRAMDQEHALAVTRDHHLIEGRDLLRVGTLADYQANPNFAHDQTDVPASLYHAPDYPGERWGMVIDLNACVGCNACVMACQAENNIPTVGREQVARGREMHWLRVDSYFFGPADNPEVHFQPVPCMQCERAPCEPVCPVEATLHSSDGLNDMVYNRCVGTRYCSNNCPYKVRRFNFLQYQDTGENVLALQRNPDVTVRTRGVMEKCTYCVQRIRHAQSVAQAQRRPVQDGEVVTACQGVCPAQAISFGDLRDAGADVARQRALPRNYAMLAELGTLPRTTYLAAVRNPNPDIT